MRKETDNKNTKTAAEKAENTATELKEEELKEVAGGLGMSRILKESGLTNRPAKKG